MLDWLKNNVESARSKLALEVTKFKNRDFMDALVAGCALVSAADGNISAIEKQRMAGFIQNSDELKVFDLKDVITSFNGFCQKFEFDAEIGKAEALRAVGKIRNKPDAARLLVRVCCAIGSSDGQFDESEKTVCRGICVELGLNPADFGL
ncbi:MAG: Tellurite resistance TerB [Pseudomonas sp.]|jgi:tellurite resistance protein TerB|uniref:Tellurite resistance protein TerB n=1 Tax=Pseudomonas saponiphila TaxID=556534 RepID=A0A1H4ZDL9_9PSED|nr:MULTISPECIES: tellurite resistance TerB family protein [Pseudomonas]TXH87969.1 MAG: Tellurite resistance TerB [Pseudomonas sp.]HBO6963449.1 tellurite resistance TerB family protein [Pseudomonas aeruginosa]NMY53301.1 tellurite resistance TerB family protein [Pseudomonas sp. WS 5011]SED28239.1 tellurite resistance protein TerB [Pseudomonas saponiphila]HBO7218572.1 tellurite resistance TerB family protein [Pseudomonas aeruginosa]